MLKLEFKNVAYKHILHDINFTAPPGKLIVLTGHNGAGKSTLFRLITKEILPTHGIIIAPRVVSLMHQNLHDNLFLSLSVYENFCLFGIQDRKIIEDYLGTFSSHISLSQTVEKLSGGQKQTLALALRLYKKPEVLLLDEVTSALDPAAAQRLLALITTHTKDIICIMITHHLAEVMSFSPQILTLEKGKITSLLCNTVS